MANKQATVYIIDQGRSTANCNNGRVESDFNYGMKYVWDKIATALADNKVSIGVGVLGLRSDGTKNSLYKPLDEDGNEPEIGDEDYEHITVLKELGPILKDHLAALQDDLHPSSTDSGDALSAIVVAVDMIEKFTMLKSGKPGKFTRKIMLVTDGQGPIEGDDQVSLIAERINELDIELVVMGADFDDAEYGFKEEDKSEMKAINESILKRLVELCNNGVFGTTVEAVESLLRPTVKTTRPFATYKGKLALGDYVKYPNTALYIDVERYFKTKAAKPPSASSVVIQHGESSSQASNTISDNTNMEDAGSLSAIKNFIIYEVNDPSSATGKKHVDRGDLAKGFEYGRTAVHISQSDENITKLGSIEEFSIIGFIPTDNYERYLNMGEACITIASKVNEKAQIALSSLVHALAELESYAVARFVPKAGKDPVILLLAPLMEPGLEALVDVPLPFAEDVRMYRFPPLDRVITTSGATVSKHRNLPSEALLETMSDYVDALDLSTLEKDDEGNPTEYMPIKDTYSPAVHRINQAIRKRATNPGDPIDPPADILMQWSHPPKELVTQTAVILHKLTEAADVRKVLAKKKGRRFNRETINPLSGLDVDSLLNQNKRTKISPNNSIPEFKQMISNSDSKLVADDAVKQMSKIIFRLVEDSAAEPSQARALENMRVFRQELLDMEMATTYNEFIREFKKRLLSGDLGGDKREFFIRLRGAKLGLIDHMTSPLSDVTEEEAIKFYSMKVELPNRGR